MPSSADSSATARRPRLRVFREAWFWFFLSLTAYLALILPTVGRQGISWDEQTDLLITRAYLAAPGGWLTGSPLDPSQTRLPMAAVALVYALLGRQGLTTARLVSVLAGGFTLLGVFLYGKRRFGALQGVLACWLLSISPFFLAFARVAFTETDIYLACAFIWLLIGIARYQDRPSFARAAWVGLLLGLSLSVKFTSLAVIPAAWFAVLASSQRRARKLAQACLMTGLAALTFLLIPPEHLANPAILRSLLWRAENEMSFNPGFMLESAALHALSILFKSSPLAGAALLTAPLLAVSQWRRRAVQAPLVLVGLYSAGLLILPISQTFYSVPLLPALALLAADAFARLASRRRAAALALAGLALAWCCVDLALCYPDFNLSGYPYLGARPLAGRSSIGYRSVVQTPSDGIQQCIEWLNAHAAPGDRVTAYVSPWHIVEAFAPDPPYFIASGIGRRSFASPEYIVTNIGDQLWQGWGPNDTPPANIFAYPYDPAWLEANYREVFAVRRAFGLTVAQVWQRK